MDSIMQDWRTPALSLAAGVIGGLIALLGQQLTSSREYDAKMVEVAIGVLRAPPTGNAELQGVREWATGMINRHSGVYLKDGAKKALESKELPYRPGGEYRTRSY